MRPAKPYRLYFRKETGYYFFKLPGGKWRTTNQTKEHEAHAYVLRLLSAGPAPNQDPHLVLKTRYPELRLRDYALPAFDRYVEAKRAAAGAKSSLSPDYVDSSRRYLKRFLLEDPFGQLELGKITADDFQAFQTRLLLEILPGHRTTAIRALEAVRLVLRRAERLGHILRSPDHAVDVAQPNSRQRGIYTDAELQALFPADVWERKDFAPWADALDYTAGILAASTGMRRCEVLAVSWDGVHLEPGKEYVEIRGSARAGGVVGPTKGKRPRATPIFDFVLWPDRRAVKALQELRRQRPPLSRVVGMDGVPIAEGPVFGAVPGHRYSATWWAKRFRRALAEAEIDRNRGQDLLQLDAHSLRHSLASRLKAAGLPDDLIRRFCGWSSINVQERYTHIGADVFTRIMELVRVTQAN